MPPPKRASCGPENSRSLINSSSRRVPTVPAQGAPDGRATEAPGRGLPSPAGPAAAARAGGPAGGAGRRRGPEARGPEAGARGARGHSRVD